MKIPYSEKQLEFVDNITNLLNNHFGQKFTSTTEQLKYVYNNSISEELVSYLKPFPKDDLNSLYVTACINGINFRIDYLSEDKLGLIVYFKIGKIYFSNKDSEQVYSDVNEIIKAMEEILIKVQLQ